MKNSFVDRMIDERQRRLEQRLRGRLVLGGEGLPELAELMAQDCGMRLIEGSTLACLLQTFQSGLVARHRFSFLPEAGSMRCRQPLQFNKRPRQSSMINTRQTNSS
jgi:hypothetical protein